MKLSFLADAEESVDPVIDRVILAGFAGRSSIEVEAHIEKLKALKELGVDQFAGYLQHDHKEETLRVYGETVIPALREHVVAKA